MSIVENASEISKNNETIAKNMQKVYDAGVRSGLAQDPDYAEGFEDGHTQGLSDASGVIWEDLLSGEIPVGKAREADHAAEATHSINADRAALADKATESDHAATATNANYSVNSGRSAEADHSDTATNATHADRATNADNADRAEFAGHATSATQAASANTADIAKALEGVLPVENGGTGAGTVDGALAVLGLTHAAAIAVGTYEGDGSSEKTIEFPFTPMLVCVMRYKTVKEDYDSSGVYVEYTETKYDTNEDYIGDKIFWIYGVDSLSRYEAEQSRDVIFTWNRNSFTFRCNKSDKGKYSLNYKNTHYSSSEYNPKLMYVETSYYTYIGIGFAEEKERL